MRFLDEKPMWHYDTERLAKRLSNKSETEVQEILDKHDVICLRSCERPKTKMMGRTLMPFVWCVCIVLCCAKWIITGDSYLDSLVKKYKFLDRVFRYTGIKE